MLHIDLKSRGPIYEKLEKGIMKQISSGLLLPDEQLPSVRTMALDLGINPNTVQKAYSELEQKGIVYTINGKGVFVSPGDDSRNAIQQLTLSELRKSSELARDSGVLMQQQISVVTNVYEGGNESDRN